MLTRRGMLEALGAAGLAGPLLSACGHAGDAPPTVVKGMTLVSAGVARSSGSPAAVPGVVRSMGELAADLWPHLAGQADNLAISPYSIAVALGMTVNGADRRTRNQMLDVLHVDSLATHNAGIATLTRDVEALAGRVENATGKPGEVSVNVANALFGDRAETWLPAFLTVLAKQYGAGVRTVDFRHDPEAARQAIDEWTSEQTSARIPQILPEGSVDVLTRLVLVDALYLKAPWDRAFEQHTTGHGRFHVTAGRTVDVDMMRSTQNASYVSGTHYRGARIPYAGGHLAMTVVLPAAAEVDALAELLGGLGRPPAPRPAALSMPRWTFRVSSDLTSPLERLGMTLAFDAARADFSAMTADERLHVADVLHQTVVAVDEQGTEAAAATAVVMEAASGLGDAETVVLDRPFLFAIHDTAHGAPLVVGRVADPS